LQVSSTHSLKIMIYSLVLRSSTRRRRSRSRRSRNNPPRHSTLSRGKEALPLHQRRRRTSQAARALESLEL